MAASLIVSAKPAHSAHVRHPAKITCLLLQLPPLSAALHLTATLAADTASSTPRRLCGSTPDAGCNRCHSLILTVAVLECGNGRISASKCLCSPPERTPLTTTTTTTATAATTATNRSHFAGSSSLLN
jgi:hypothetical protein